MHRAVRGCSGRDTATPARCPMPTWTVSLTEPKRLDGQRSLAPRTASRSCVRYNLAPHLDLAAFSLPLPLRIARRARSALRFGRMWECGPSVEPLRGRGGGPRSTSDRLDENRGPMTRIEQHRPKPAASLRRRSQSGFSTKRREQRSSRPKDVASVCTFSSSTHPTRD